LYKSAVYISDESSSDDELLYEGTYVVSKADGLYNFYNL